MSDLGENKPIKENSIPKANEGEKRKEPDDNKKHFKKRQKCCNKDQHQKWKYDKKAKKMYKMMQMYYGCSPYYYGMESPQVFNNLPKGWKKRHHFEIRPPQGMYYGMPPLQGMYYGMLPPQRMYYGMTPSPEFHGPPKQWHKSGYFGKPPKHWKKHDHFGKPSTD